MAPELNRRDRIGLDPADIVDASPDQLVEIATKGGLHGPKRAARLVDASERLIEEHGGDPDIGRSRSSPPSASRASIGSCCLAVASSR